jgi:hypothetical protein
MGSKILLAYITESVDQEILLQNEYLVTGNRLLHHQLQGCVRLTDAEQKTLADIGKKPGKQALEDGATIVKPNTILAWHRRFVAKKLNGSQQRKALGRPKIDPKMTTHHPHISPSNQSCYLIAAG